MILDANLVAEMKRVALENPHNPGCEPMAPMICCREGVEYKGCRLSIMITFEYFEPQSPQQVWHLSIMREDGILPESILEEIKNMVFREKSKVERIPLDAFPEEMRKMQQFYQIITDKKFDILNKKWV